MKHLRFGLVLIGGFLLGWFAHLLFAQPDSDEKEQGSDGILRRLQSFADSDRREWTRVGRQPNEEFFKLHALNIDKFFAGNVPDHYEVWAGFDREADHWRAVAEDREVRVHVWWRHRAMPGSGREYIFWKDSGKLRGIRFHSGH